MPWVLFFDGECGFCNQWVRRVARRDRDGRIHFAPLQGQLAARHELGNRLSGSQASLILLHEETGEVLSKSAAVLQVLHLLRGGWKCLLVFRLIPCPWRDRIYEAVARNRHRLARKQASVCEIPGIDLAGRMRE